MPRDFVLLVPQLLQHAGEDPPIAIGPFGHGKMHRDHAAVLVKADDLPTGADHFRFAGLHVVGEVGVVAVRIRRGHEQADVLADHLDQRVAKELLAGLVKGVDGARFVDDHGGHEEVVEHLPLLLEDGLLEAGGLLGLAQDAGEHAQAVALLPLGERQVDGHQAAVLQLAKDVSAAADHRRRRW